MRGFKENVVSLTVMPSTEEKKLVCLQKAGGSISALESPSSQLSAWYWWSILGNVVTRHTLLHSPIHTHTDIAHVEPVALKLYIIASSFYFSEKWQKKNMMGDSCLKWQSCPFGEVEFSYQRSSAQRPTCTLCICAIRVGTNQELIRVYHVPLECKGETLPWDYFSHIIRGHSYRKKKTMLPIDQNISAVPIDVCVCFRLIQTLRKDTNKCSFFSLMCNNISNNIIWATRSDPAGPCQSHNSDEARGNLTKSKKCSIQWCGV